MKQVPVLEELSYPGREGGYITRITGKLMQESATKGVRNLFLPIPKRKRNQLIYSGHNPTADPIFEVPGEFYGSVYLRLQGIFGVDSGSPSGIRTVTYSSVDYIFQLTLVANGAAISIEPSNA